MRKNSRAKGKRGELEWVRVCKFEGFSAFRGAQHCGKNLVTGDAAPDVVVPDLGLHYEVKRVEKLNLADALAQAKADANDGELAAVAHRKNNGGWMVTMTAEDHFAMARESSYCRSEKTQNKEQ